MTSLARRGGEANPRCFGIREREGGCFTRRSLPYDDLWNPNFVEADNNDNDV